MDDVAKILAMKSAHEGVQALITLTTSKMEAKTEELEGELLSFADLEPIEAYGKAVEWAAKCLREGLEEASRELTEGSKGNG